MNFAPEKFAAANTASLAASLKSFAAVADCLAAATQNLSTLNLVTLRAWYDDSVAHVGALAAAKSPKAALALQLGVVTPGAEKAIAYLRKFEGIARQTQAELVRIHEAEALAVSRNVEALVDGMLKDAPAGSDLAVVALKTSLSNAKSAYANANQIARQLGEAAQASLGSVTSAAAHTMTKTASAAVVGMGRAA